MTVEFKRSFDGMTEDPVAIEELLAVRDAASVIGRCLGWPPLGCDLAPTHHLAKRTKDKHAGLVAGLEQVPSG